MFSIFSKYCSYLNKMNLYVIGYDLCHSPGAVKTTQCLKDFLKDLRHRLTKMTPQALKKIT